MPNIVVLVKQVPDTYSERKLSDSDYTWDRESADAVLDETDERLTHLEASLPAVISVSEKINEPRYPSFKGIMAAKKKPVETLSVADLGVDDVGLSSAWSTVTEAAPKPPREAGQRVEDEGDGGAKAAQYL